MMKHSKQNRTRRGFTLVELLVVIVIATIVLSIAIPRIRTVNKERNLREAARTVGSAFANASQRAAIDGSAGVRITRNVNLLDSNDNPFAATEISMLRAVPTYSGDQESDRIVALNGGRVSIRKPLEQDSLNIVQTGDFMSFGGSSVQFRIDDVNDTGSELELSLGRGSNNYMPLPPDTSKLVPPLPLPTYVIHRRPRLLRSSTADLPSGNIIDLRYSGFEAAEIPASAPDDDPAEITYVCSSNPRTTNGSGVISAGSSYTIDVVFKEDGAIDQVFYISLDDPSQVVSRVPLGPLYLMIAETPLTFDPAETTALTSDPQSLWVAIAGNGSSNIGYVNVQADQTEEELFESADFEQIILDSRDSSLSTSATQ